MRIIPNQFVQIPQNPYSAFNSSGHIQTAIIARALRAFDQYEVLEQYRITRHMRARLAGLDPTMLEFSEAMRRTEYPNDPAPEPFASWLHAQGYVQLPNPGGICPVHSMHSLDQGICRAQIPRMSRCQPCLTAAPWYPFPTPQEEQQVMPQSPPTYRTLPPEGDPTIHSRKPAADPTQREGKVMARAAIPDRPISSPRDWPVKEVPVVDKSGGVRVPPSPPGPEYDTTSTLQTSSYGPWAVQGRPIPPIPVPEWMKAHWFDELYFTAVQLTMRAPLPEDPNHAPLIDALADVVYEIEQDVQRSEERQLTFLEGGARE